MRFAIRAQRVLLEKRFSPADIVIEDGYIHAVLPYGTADSACDFGEKMIVPGFIDLHSDAVEKEIEPRPGAEFPVANALIELDKKLAMAGITTMFHAVSFNDESLVGQRGTAMAANLIRTIADYNANHLTIDNLVHGRYEITSFSSVPVIGELLEEGKIQLLSFMDHSPGQGQFRTLEKWKLYHKAAYALSEDVMDEVISRKLKKQQHSLEFLCSLADQAKHHKVILASHDDDRPEKIELMGGLGGSIAEFPLNAETAHYARAHGMSTGMGAPNVVRGRSQSGNISARELIGLGCCDFLCSDYHPGSMLQAPFVIGEQLGLEPAEAFAFITANPAATVQLHDRGRIAAGLLGDLVVIDDRLLPKVIVTLKNGRTVYSDGTCLCTQEKETAYAN